jgi:hypothetical protein
MSLLRLLNIQGIAGIAVGLVLGILLLIQRGETRHWQKQSGQFEQLYTKEQAALAGTIANYRAAVKQAEASDKANADRVAAEQRTINERTTNDFEARLAAARSLAQRLRGQSTAAAADPGRGGAAPVPGLPAPARGPAQAAGQDRLSQSDERARKDRGALGPEDALTATEQAIQLDELIKWVRAQAAVDPNAPR